MLPNKVLLTLLLASVIMFGGCLQTSPMLTASSALLNAMTLHSETVCFFEAAVLNNQTRSVQALSIPIGILKLSLKDLGVYDQIFTKQLGYILLGAKEFQSPTGLGVSRSRKVHFLGFRKPRRLDLQTLAKKAPVAKIMGNPVWQWEIKEPETNEPLQFFIIQPLDTEIWVATDIEYLEAVLTSLKTAEPVVENRPEWREVSLSAPVWAVRRYTHDKWQDPIETDIRLSRTATAITFSYDTERHNAVIRGLASSTEGLLENWRSHSPGDVSEIRTGVWQISFAVNDDSLSIDKIYALAGLFGFAIHV